MLMSFMFHLVCQEITHFFFSYTLVSFKNWLFLVYASLGTCSQDWGIHLSPVGYSWMMAFSCTSSFGLPFPQESEACAVNIRYPQVPCSCLLCQSPPPACFCQYCCFLSPRPPHLLTHSPLSVVQRWETRLGMWDNRNWFRLVLSWLPLQRRY